MTTQTEDKIYSMRAGLIVLLAFFSFHTHSRNLTIAFIDTNFCLEKSLKVENVIINKAIDATNSNSSTCVDYSKTSRKYHAQQVLNNFLSKLSTNRALTIQPITVFDKNGQQKKSYWKRALKNQKDYDVIVMAAGLIEAIGPKITTPILVAGATYGKGIKKTTKVWPQSEFSNPLIITIGSYLEANDDLGTRADFNLIHEDQMKFFFSSGPENSPLQGTSRAVSSAAARAIKICRDAIVKKRSLYKCLKKRSRKIKLSERSSSVLSF